MSDTEGTSRKPGTRTMTAGLFIAAMPFVLILLALHSGGGPTVLTINALGFGFLVAVIGFVRRVLAAMKRYP
jgi:hypothetical protein